MGEHVGERGPAGAAVVVGLLLLFGGTLAFALQDPVSAWERGAFAVVNRLPEALFTPLWVAMQAGQVLAVPVVAAGAFLAGRRLLAARLAVAGAAAYVTAVVVKTLVARARPDGILEAVVVRGDPQTGLGFVSGHATIAAALATVATASLGPRGRAVVWTGAVLVALGRVYVGAHLPLDVVGGVAVGVLIGVVTRRAVRARAPRRTSA